MLSSTWVRVLFPVGGETRNPSRTDLCVLSSPFGYRCLHDHLRIGNGWFSTWCHFDDQGKALPFRAMLFPRTCIDYFLLLASAIRILFPSITCILNFPSTYVNHSISNHRERRTRKPSKPRSTFSRLVHVILVFWRRSLQVLGRFRFL